MMIFRNQSGQISVASALRDGWQMLFSALVVSLCISLLGLFFFVRGRILLADQLKIRLRSTAAVASLQFDGANIEQIKTREDMEKEIYANIVYRLQEVVSNVPDIRFAYILRRTDDPNILEFVADADSLRTDEELDRNRNGTVDGDEEASYPGDLYDATDVPAMRIEAFLHPVSDQETTEDQWGHLISGYAPIRRWDNGKIVGILGVDMRADEYWLLSNSVFSPVALFLVLMAAGFLASYIVLSDARRRLEELRAVDAERSELLLLASHQLGTPLTLFKWSLELLHEKDKQLAEIIPLHEERLREAIARMEIILHSVRDAAAFEEGRVQIQWEKLSLSNAIHDVRQWCDQEMGLSRFPVDLELDSTLEVNVDRAMLRTVFEQLLQNAISFSLNANAISIRTSRQRKFAQVEIEDHGSGIPAEDIPRLFGKFVRGSNAVMHQANGNGLGLYIARAIVRRFGGDMWIRSEEGKGTTVTFTLPLA